MKKPDHINSRQNNNAEDNLLLAIIMGGIGFFTGFTVWFIVPATFGISAIFYLLLSILLAAGFFAFGFMQPEKTVLYLDRGWEYIVRLIRQVIKRNKKNK